jgi:hypothetical protein
MTAATITPLPRFASADDDHHICPEHIAPAAPVK